MARKKHEDHINHEAWAIPYGDLITLLLAFFVVMYSISSVNEGKFRVLSDALSQAFGGPPKSIKPIQLGTKRQSGSNSDQKINVLNQITVEQSIGGSMRGLKNPSIMPGLINSRMPQQQVNLSGNTGYNGARATLQRMAESVQRALGPLIDRKLVIVRQTDLRLEIEIRADILFASGAAQVDERAAPTLKRVAAILRPFPNPVRIEGHTDDIPIHTIEFASNWELSAARAASVVHLFMEDGVEPSRMSVEGLGEYRPVATNHTDGGRNRNRRVVVVVLANPDQPIELGGVSPAPASSLARPAKASPALPAAAAAGPGAIAPAPAASSPSAKASA